MRTSNEIKPYMIKESKMKKITIIVTALHVESGCVQGISDGVLYSTNLSGRAFCGDWEDSEGELSTELNGKVFQFPLDASL